MIADPTRPPGCFRGPGASFSPGIRAIRMWRGVNVVFELHPDQETRLTTDPPPGFSLDDMTVGPFAHGFGTTGDGRSFAFRTLGSALTLEIYRPGLAADVPGPEDVVARGQARVTDIDLEDARSVRALVCDLIPVATPFAPSPPPAGREATTVRALLLRLSAVLDAI